VRRATSGESDVANSGTHQQPGRATVSLENYYNYYYYYYYRFRVLGYPLSKFKN